MTAFMPIMWILWAVSVTVLLGLLLYRSNLTRYEEDQLFLDESFNRIQAEQTALVQRVHRMEPALHVTEAIAALLTAAIIINYLWSAIRILL